MNRIKHKRLMCVLLLLLISATSLIPAQANGEATVRELLSGIGELLPVLNTPYLIAKDEPKGTQYGVFNTDGEQLIPYAYAGLYYLGFNCFVAVKDASVQSKKTPTLEDINSNALVTADGTQISDYLYGYVEIFSTYWVCGWVLKDGTADDYDLTSGKSYYKISRCDFFYLGDHALVGVKGTEELPQPLSLSRYSYKTAKSHGKYLYVQNRNNYIKVYDSQFNVVNVEAKSLDDPMYVIWNYSVMPRDISDMLADGYTAVQEVQTEAGMLLKATRLDYSGSKWSTVFTCDGKQLMPLIRGEIDTVTKDYAVLNANQKRGLYSFKENKLLVPCAYDKVLTTDGCLDPYVQHGYAYVEKGGTRYYLHVSDGKLYESASPGKKWTKMGFMYVLNDGANSQYRLYTPDQRLNDVKGIKLVKGQNFGSGYLLSCSRSYSQNMLVSWRGEVLLKDYINAFTITNDDKAIIQKRDGTYSLIEVVYNEWHISVNKD